MSQALIGSIIGLAFFGGFAAVLAWGWWYTRDSRPSFPHA